MTRFIRFLFFLVFSIAVSGVSNAAKGAGPWSFINKGAMVEARDAPDAGLTWLIGCGTMTDYSNIADDENQGAVCSGRICLASISSSSAPQSNNELLSQCLWINVTADQSLCNDLKEATLSARTVFVELNFRGGWAFLRVFKIGQTSCPNPG